MVRCPALVHHVRAMMLRIIYAHTIATSNLLGFAMMLQFDKAPKKATNLSLNAKVLETAKQLGMNISQTVDTLLADEVKRRYWQKWRDDNREAFEAYNERIRQDGLPLAKYRTWGKSLGDGRVTKA